MAELGKKLFGQKILGSKIFLGQNYFLVNKIFWLKFIFDKIKILGKKNQKNQNFRQKKVKKFQILGKKVKKVKILGKKLKKSKF